MPYVLPTFQADDVGSLKGFRAALLTTHGPELPEFHVPVAYLRERGASVDIVTQDWIFDSQMGEASGLVVLAQWLATNVVVKADTRVSLANVTDYDAIVLIGGAWNPIMLRTDSHALRFLREAHLNKVLIAALCHGPQVLISMGTFPKGTRATGVDDIKGDLANAGFSVEEGHAVYDPRERLLTSPNPGTESLQAFCQELGKQARQLLLERT
jgi:protease I